MRLFAAVPLPVSVRDHAAAALGPVVAEAPPQVHAVDGRRWHLTLAFFGEVADGDVAGLSRRLTAAAARWPPVRLHLEHAGRFGERVLWLGVSGDGDILRGVARSVAAAGRHSGIAVEDRPYRPHLTVARARPPADLRPLVTAMAGYRGPDWTADHVELVHSVLGPDPTHTTLATFPLTPSPPPSR